MSLVFLYINSTVFDTKDHTYFPWLHFLTISKYSFLLFEPIAGMVKLLTHQTKHFQHFDVGKFEYRKKKTAK